MFQSAIKFYNLELECINTSTLGGKIRRARKLYGLTQDALAKLTGISPATIHELEINRNCNCTRTTLKKLCKIFPEKLILTDYHEFLYNQREYLNDIDPNFIATKLNLQPSTIIRWQKEIYLVKYEYYIKLKELGLIP